MTKPLTYRPFNGLEYAFRPDIVDAMAGEDGPMVEDDQVLDLSGLRPVREEIVETTVESHRGKYVFHTTTTTRLITNRPIHLNTTNKENKS